MHITHKRNISQSRGIDEMRNINSLYDNQQFLSRRYSPFLIDKKLIFQSQRKSPKFDDKMQLTKQKKLFLNNKQTEPKQTRSVFRIHNRKIMITQDRYEDKPKQLPFIGGTNLRWSNKLNPQSKSSIQNVKKRHHTIKHTKHESFHGKYRINLLEFDLN